MIHHIDGLEEKNHTIISVDKVKNLMKFSIPYDKSPEETRNKSNCPIKAICNRLIFNTMLSGEN